VTRAGIGFDAHGFDDSRPLILGGVEIPDGPGLAGHSDADVLSHAIADAILGAARLGDLGTMFPDDDAHKGISSMEILDRTVTALEQMGWSVANVDATILAEHPKLSGYRDDMITSIARAMHLSRDAVWVKATTTDGMGFTGRAEGVAALAVVLIEEDEDLPTAGPGFNE
jgi:2-C-methyl-D-erythritol 2,4-cyclodiphosphate synthase